MLLVDLMQIVIPNVTVACAKNGGDFSPSLFRNMIFKSLAAHKRNFSPKYTEEIIICIDDREYWRREVFPPYKYSRKKSREESALDWTRIFEFVNIMKDDLKRVLPYKVLQVPKAEADDIIAVLCHKFGDYRIKAPPIMIISGDKDLTQLLKFANVEQYDPVRKVHITCNNPESYLLEHVIRGDFGDGIPNFLSPDDQFINPAKRQASIMQAKVNEWVRQRPEDFCTSEVMKTGFSRNKLLIDLTQIPQDLQQLILKTYEDTAIQDKSKLLNYFIQHSMPEMARQINHL